MPPKSKPFVEPSKQKILTSFFSKASGEDVGKNNHVVKPSPFRTPAAKGAAKDNVAKLKLEDTSQNQNLSSPVFPKTPESRSFHVNSSVVRPTLIVSSERASSPPTSDPIDIDMVDSDVEEPQLTLFKSVSTNKRKRRVPC